MYPKCCSLSKEKLCTVAVFPVFYILCLAISGRQWVGRGRRQAFGERQSVWKYCWKPWGLQTYFLFYSILKGADGKRCAWSREMGVRWKGEQAEGLVHTSASAPVSTGLLEPFHPLVVIYSPKCPYSDLKGAHCLWSSLWMVFLLIFNFADPGPLSALFLL